LRTPITASTPTTLGVLVLVAAATWTVADRWFGVTARLDSMDARLAKIEAKLETIRRDSK